MPTSYDLSTGHGEFASRSVFPCTFKRFGDLLHTHIQPFISSRSALIVDNLAVDIIVTAKELAVVAIASTPAEKREKQQKALMVRKRKAWSDLLKELKRAGFTVNVKPDILRQQSDARWIREQPILQSSLEASATVAKGEDYYNRLNGALPTLRSSLSGHHPDLVTRDLQKGVMFVESVFAMAVDSRSRLADAFVNYEILRRLAGRLNVLLTSPNIAFYGPTMTHQVYQTRNILCKLASALQEIIQGLGTFNSLQPSPPVPYSLLEQARVLELSTQALVVQVKHICSQLNSSSTPILLEDERVVVTAALEHFAKTMVNLELWADTHPRLRHLFVPVRSWLVSQPQVLLSSDIDSPAVESTDAVIDLFLVHVQTMLSACTDSAANDEDGERDKYIEHDYHSVRNLTRLLKLRQTTDSLNNAVRQLAVHGRNIQTNLQRILPFLNLYLQLAHRQLMAHSEWTKALFKLDFVLCSVTQTIAKDGFCKPPDDDNAGAGWRMSRRMMNRRLRTTQIRGVTPTQRSS
ncbi:hypothetical protein B0H11DRAFT_788317 [Mycena galericulata]|nr:hypothetical protein B0H11DRAFT_788317 [Mycena galericulata]